ncbi:MAG: 4Fe-4S dicluster domain-containing protein [Chloroflexi bacterium]|nr:4Fe-4S dicluster domain-containing protein [Chloroflexota bacterium]
MDNVAAVFLLNYLAGSVGRRGGIVFNPEPPTAALGTRVQASPFLDWQRLMARMSTGQPRPVNAVLVYQANPVYGLPQQVDPAGALKQVPFVVSFAGILDETSAQADIVLPVHHALEEWGADAPDPGPGFQIVSYQQPVVNPTGDTRSFADALLAIGKGIGDDVARALPWASSLEWLQNTTRELHKLDRGSVAAPDFPTFWNRLLQQGVWSDEKATAGPPPPPVAAFNRPDSAAFSGTERDYPYHLIPFPSHSLGDGAGSHLPWLQATPDPLTTVVWRTWVEIGPETARSLAVTEGDIVEVSSVSGKLEAPVYVHPLMPTGIVSIPFGQGHLTYTRYGRGMGANVTSVLAPILQNFPPVMKLEGADQVVSETASLAWAATRVNLKPTGRRAPLPKAEGVVPALPLPSPEIIQVTGVSGSAAPGPGGQPAAGGRYRWAMAVDLDRCTGCEACVVACQAENNIPLNPDEWFLQLRAFEWIRVERYWDLGAPEPRARFLPVLCQHCTNAPCEPVCPVYATSHNDEGLNIQVYPRCIGTRFCANNCPYQVRFFNFWPAVWPQSMRNYLNPSVTVRPRGLIEKCTFCVQRINAGARRARREGRAVQDGDITPACAQACPTNALVFGNVLDRQSQVFRLSRDPRAYRLLEHLGTEPAVTYLKKVDIHVA